MIGDLFLWARKSFKQTFCIHHYVVKGIYDIYSYGGFLKCTKCGRMRK